MNSAFTTGAALQSVTVFEEHRCNRVSLDSAVDFLG